MGIAAEKDLAKASFLKLKTYCEQEEFKGWDPFDGLNSRLFNALPTKNSRLARLAWLQLFKRSPYNLRKITSTPKGHNAKGLGLFLTGYCNLYRVNPQDETKQKIQFLIDKLFEHENTDYSGSCWGYNFDWQARAFFQPKGTPTVVATTFIGYALLDAYEITQDQRLLDKARSACNFILKDLNRSYEGDNFAFSYSPLDNTSVFNATLLGCRLLSRVYSFTYEKNLIEEARKGVAYCCNHQKRDGSWAYSTLPYHQWIDSFHTGYNLEGIAEYQKYSGDKSFAQNLENGLSFYLKNFFLSDGTPKYYHNQTLPIDIHSPAQLILTLIRTGKLIEHIDLGEKVIQWTIANMQSEKGYFYYQKKKFWSSKIPYIRWSQAWMFYALSFYLFSNR